MYDQHGGYTCFVCSLCHDRPGIIHFYGLYVRLQHLRRQPALSRHHKQRLIKVSRVAVFAHQLQGTVLILPYLVRKTFLFAESAIFLAAVL